MKELIQQLIKEELNKPQKTFYFMAGLPRSGSTLLSTILNQNPKFYSGPSSPVTSIMLTLENAIANDELFLAYPKREQASQIISNVLHQYYSDVDRPVIFDKNRSWVNRMHYISGYFGTEPKVICPVRNIDEILASFIAMHRRNPFEVNGRVNFIDEMLIKSNMLLNDDNRCSFIAGPNGILGQSYNGIKQALMEGRQKQLHFVEYDDLLNNPEETMRKIYEFLGQEYYPHTFNELNNSHKENDAAVYGLADMHEVRSEFKKRGIDPTEYLSEEVLKNCENAEFWRNIGEYVEEEQQPAFEQINNNDDTNLIGG